MAAPIHLYRNHHPAEAFMNLKAPSPWKLFAELPTQRKVDVIAVAIFLPLLCLKLMLTFSPLVLFLIVLGPCLIWIQSTKVAWWHAEQLPQGYYLRPKSILNVPSIVAMAVGLAAAGALDWLGSNYAVLGAAFSLSCALIGLLFLGLLFSAIGVRCGWARVVDPTEADDSLKGQPVITLARPPKSLLRSNIIYTLCIVGLLFTVVGYYIQIRAIDGPSDTDTSGQTAADPTSQGIDTPSDVQTPAQAAQAPQEQPQAAPAQPTQPQLMSAPTAQVTPEVAAMTAADVAQATHANSSPDQLFNVNLIGTTIAHYETIAGPAVKVVPMANSVESRAYQVNGCTVEIGVGHGTITAISIALNSSCAISETSLPSYLQGQHLDLGYLTFRGLAKLANNSPSTLELNCAAQNECGNGTDPSVILTIEGSQADGFINATFNGPIVTAADTAVLAREMPQEAKKLGVSDMELTSKAYNQDASFLKHIVPWLSGVKVTTLMLSEGN